jgi:hypothetical protein
MAPAAAPFQTPVAVRSAHVRQAVRQALRHWHMQRWAAPAWGPPPIDYPPLASVLQPIERRPRLVALDEKSDAFLPAYVPHAPKASLWRSLKRLLAWIGLITSLMWGQWMDALLRRDTVARRAVRLRRVPERA